MLFYKRMDEESPKKKLLLTSDNLSKVWARTEISSIKEMFNILGNETNGDQFNLDYYLILHLFIWNFIRC